MEILADAFLDAVKLLPFLFCVYLFLEYIEGKTDSFLKSFLMRTGRFGPICGALVGCVPQCGFSVVSSKLFSKNFITAGTLVAVFVSTSDDAIPIILADRGNWKEALLLMGVKVLCGLCAGLLLDLFFRSKLSQKLPLDQHGHAQECHHRHGILLAAIRHTVLIFLYIFVASVLLGSFIHVIGEEAISAFLSTHTLLAPMLTALVGLIPNCAASVLITQVYLSGAISFGAAVAGLCTGAGAGLLVLFRENKSLKQNIAVVCYLYGISVLFGLLIELLF